MSMSAEDLQKAQEAEYGTYVATQTIFVGLARAFNEGDPVPASHVERGVVPKDAVARTATRPATAPKES